MNHIFHDSHRYIGMNMVDTIGKAKNLLRRLSQPDNPDPNAAIYEFHTKMVLIVLAFVCILFSLVSTVGWLYYAIPSDTLFIVVMLSLVFVAGWLLTNAGMWRVSSFLPPLFLLVTAFYGTYIGGIDAPAILIYALAIIMVAVLIGIKSMYWTLAVSLVAYLAVGLGHHYGLITQQRSAKSAFVNRVVIVTAVLIGITLLLHFLTLQFRMAIRKANNELQEKEKVQSQLLQAQKMEIIGTLTSGFAHDFNNILGGIMGSLSLLDMQAKKEADFDRQKAQRYIKIAMDSSQRAAQILRQLLLLSRRREIRTIPVDLNQSVANVVNICKTSFPKSVCIREHYGTGPMIVMADAAMIEQALLNFCVNGAEAMTLMRGPGRDEGGVLDIALAERELPGRAGSFIQVTIADSGVGMAPETLRKLFEPFFSTNKHEKGTGLGLFMAQDFINRVGGFIEVESSPGSGSVFRIHLPKIDAGVATVPEQVGDENLVPGQGTVLVVDDEDEIRSIAAEVLQSCGYRVLTANDGWQAVELYRAKAHEIAAVLLDVAMPRMTGNKALEKLREINPSVRVLMSSGHSEDERVVSAMKTGALGFLHKPYTAEQLSQAIAKILPVGPETRRTG